LKSFIVTSPVTNLLCSSLNAWIAVRSGEYQKPS